MMTQVSGSFASDVNGGEVVMHQIGCVQPPPNPP